MDSSKVQKIYLNEIFISILKRSLKDLGKEKFYSDGFISSHFQALTFAYTSDGMYPTDYLRSPVFQLKVVLKQSLSHRNHP